MKFSAAVFNLDGTVIDSEWAWGQSLKNVLRSLGVNEKRKYPQVGGIGVSANWKILKEKYGLKGISIEGLTSKTFGEFIKLIPQIKLMRGLERFVHGLKKKKIKLALATSTDRHIVEKVFEALPIKKHFRVISTGEEVGNRKPAPDLFLLAAYKLKTDPSKCLVFEDAESGVVAARAAGMKVIAIARDKEYAKLLKDADMVVKNFEEISFNQD